MNKHKFRPCSNSFALASLCVAAATASEVPRYGAADFVPTPERPIHFRVDNGWYPGATPPVQWWDGTPIQRDGKASPQNSDELKPARLWDVADTKSKNILWKAPLPGWSLSHPIVVGDRVFVVGEPHFVACCDAATGKQLWQRDVLPLLLEGMPEPKARKLQVALDLARAMYVATSQAKSGLSIGPPNTLPSDMEGSVADRRAAARKVVALLEKHRPAIVATDEPALVTALDADLALLKQAETLEPTRESLLSWKEKLRNFPKLQQVLERQFKVQIGGSWWGYVGSADSGLASDGERIYGVFQQGQIFCYDLDGNLVWGQRQTFTTDNRSTFHRSPLLVGDVLVVKDVRGDRWLGLDRKTGKQIWETLWGGKADAHLWMKDGLMRLPKPEGGFETVMLTVTGQHIIRVRDGKVLGTYPIGGNNGRGQNMVVIGDMAAMGTAADNYIGASTFCRVRLTGPDTASAEIVHTLPDKLLSTGVPYAATTNLIVTTAREGLLLISPVDGTIVGVLPELNGMVMLAGNTAVMALDGGNSYGRKRDDRKALARYVTVDISNPRQPQLLSDQNILAYSEPPADYIMKNFLNEFDPLDFAGCYKGTVSYLVEQLSGPVAKGNRLYIQSSAFLYCVGPEVQGSPKDDPKVIAAINAASDLATLTKHLADERARYRYLALERLRALKLPLDAATRQLVTDLVSADPFEEVRASAVLLLDAADPTALPGWQTLLTQYLGVHQALKQFDVEARRPLRDIQLTLRMLGDAYLTERLPTAFTDAAAADPVRLRALLELAASANPVPKVGVDQALSVAADAQSSRRNWALPKAALGVLVQAINSDPRALPAIRTGKAYSPGTRLSALCYQLPVADLTVVLVEQLRAPGDLGHDWWGWKNPVARICQRMGADKAIPVLEKAAADRPEIAERLKGLIAGLKESMPNQLPEAQKATVKGN